MRKTSSLAPRLFYTHHHTIPLPERHKFPIEKYQLLHALLQREGEFRLEPAPLASEEVVGLVHDADYIRAFLEGTIDAGMMRKIGLPWSEQLVRRTMASVGGTLAATREALKSGWGGALAGGTHHAFAGEGSGFCVFNDIAVAVRWLLVAQETEGFNQPIGRAAVIDLDVHQGDGTAHIFQDDPAVLTLSIHCRNNFPLRKQRSKIDVELEAGTGDEEYMTALERVLPRVAEFRPDIVFYQSGVDGLESDALGHLALTLDGLRRRDRLVMESARALDVPFVITLGGGYSDPIELTVEAHANTFCTARQVFERLSSGAGHGSTAAHWHGGVA